MATQLLLVHGAFCTSSSNGSVRAWLQHRSPGGGRANMHLIQSPC